ncbi:MAG TPA: geranylgeranyl reductase family protein [Acidimicrobiia bacterium]|nr:geranylgeranyl reductase family protein [Acidimicrobiia bacterium]
MDRPFDVIVIGAGPAGVAAGIRAVEHGLATVVLDAATFPRDKTCGDGLTTNALRLLEELGLPRAALGCDAYEPVREVVLVSPSGRHVPLPIGAGGERAGVISRLQLDQALVDLARSRGVDVRESWRVAAVSPTSRGVRVLSDTEAELSARFVIACDGHFSPVRRAWQGTGPELGEWHAARQYFSGVTDRRLWVDFERDLLPGYAWVFPLPGGRANVGFGVLRDGRKGRDLKALWPDLLARPVLRDILGPAAVPEDRVRAWPIPTRYRAASLADGRVLFAGDAAAVVDPMTGEGIAQALETGMLAATAVADAPDDPELVDARYRRAVARALGTDLRFAGMLQRVLARPALARGAIRTVAINDWTRRNFARWMFEDYPRAALFTPRRWHRGMFVGAGAYGADVTV